MMRSLLHRSLLPLGFLVLLAAGGCAHAHPRVDPSPPAHYHQATKVLLDRYCNQCHQPGGIGPFALTDYASAKAHAGAIANAVRTGSMPPWMPSDAGLPLRYSRKMPP